MRIAVARWPLVLASFAAVLGIGACGGDGDDDDADGTPVATVTTTVVTPAPDTTPMPITEFKVAFINLYSPLTIDGSQVAAETFDARLALLIEELKTLGPDLIAFNEASVTEHGNAIDRLVTELALEGPFGRANPGFGLDNEAAQPFIEQAGFQEGELILSRHPILEWERLWLSPRSSELGEGRVALFARIKAPEPLGEINVVVTHLTGGGEAIRTAQATDLVNQMGERTAGRPTLLLGDMGDPAGSATSQVFQQAGFSDPAAEANIATCCRGAVVDDQPELTTRPDYILARGFAGSSIELFAHHSVTQSDGTQLYASDHNGLFAVFSLDGG